MHGFAISVLAAGRRDATLRQRGAYKELSKLRKHVPALVLMSNCGSLIMVEATVMKMAMATTTNDRGFDGGNARDQT